MKFIGISLIIVGFILGLSALNYDTSVATDHGTRVHNIGLMQQQQMHLVIATAASILGALLLIGSRRGSQQKQETRPQHQVAHPTVADELSKLALLRQSGILTEEEFAKEKQKILGASGDSISSASNFSHLGTHGSSEWLDKDPKACIAALEKRGYTVYQLRPDAWEICAPNAKSSSFAYSENDLRRVTARETAAAGKVA